MSTEMSRQQIDDHVFLIGRPPITEFFGYIKTMAADGLTANQGQLAQEWRNANDYLRELEQTEAGIADKQPTAPLPDSLREVTQRVFEDPIFQRAFQMVRTDAAIVNLDRLVVYQKFINLGYAGNLTSRLSSPPTMLEAAKLAFEMGESPVPVQAMQNAPNIFSFICPSGDFRFIEGGIVPPHQVIQFPDSGRPFAYVVLSVGFGSNYLNAIEIEGRLILNNGSNRAYALRAAGLHEAPCLIQHVTRREELDLIIQGDVQQHTDRYTKDPRPPLLKDYFDPRLCKTVSVPRKNRLVRVQFGVEQSDVPTT